MSPESRLFSKDRQPPVKPDYEKLYHAAVNQLINLGYQVDQSLADLEDLYLKLAEPEEK
jgi:hypothetical protein